MKQDYYRTTDLGLAAALALFVSLKEIRKRNEQQLEFVFPLDDELNRLIEAYWFGNMRVDPLKYFYKLRMLKVRLYSQ